MIALVAQCGYWPEPGWYPPRSQRPANRCHRTMRKPRSTPPTPDMAERFSQGQHVLAITNDVTIFARRHPFFTTSFVIRLAGCSRLEPVVADPTEALNSKRALG